MTLTTPSPTTPVLPFVEIVVDGELAPGTIGRFHRQLVEATMLRPERVVVDLGDCSFVDADTMQVLLEAHTRLWRQGGRLTLRGCGQSVLRLLATAGLRGVFDLEPAPLPEPFPVQAAAAL